MGGRTLLGALEAALGPANAAAAAACSDPVLRTARAAIDRLYGASEYIWLIRTVYGQIYSAYSYRIRPSKYIRLIRVRVARQGDQNDSSRVL